MFTRDFFSEGEVGFVTIGFIDEAEAVGDAEDVGVDRKGRNSKYLRDDHAGGFAAHAGEGVEFF